MTRIQAELLEAYVAQFERERGFKAVYDWLSQLYTPLMRHVQPINPKPSGRPAASPKAFQWLSLYAKAVGQEIKVVQSIKGEGPDKLHVCELTLGGTTVQVEVKHPSYALSA